MDRIPGKSLKIGNRKISDAETFVEFDLGVTNNPRFRSPQNSADLEFRVNNTATYTVNFDKMHWDDVLDWYAKESGLTLITTVKPTGSVTIKPNKDRKFTISEVTDLINEAMIQQKFILIRRQVTSPTALDALEELQHQIDSFTRLVLDFLAVNKNTARLDENLLLYSPIFNKKPSDSLSIEELKIERSSRSGET